MKTYDKCYDEKIITANTLLTIISKDDNKEYFIKRAGADEYNKTVDFFLNQIDYLVHESKSFFNKKGRK